MKIIYFLSVIAVVSILASCTKHFEKGEGDMEYKIITSHGASHINEGDYIAVNFTEQTAEGKVTSRSEEAHPVTMFCEKPAFKGDYFTALKMLGEGDSAVFKINIDSVKLKTGYNKQVISKSKYIFYSVKVIKVLKKGNLDGRTFTRQIEGLQNDIYNTDREVEAIKIKHYIAANHLNLVTTASGLNYIITTKGTGSKPAIGDTSLINYTGKTLNGQAFETTIASVAKKNGIYHEGLFYHAINLPDYIDHNVSGFREAAMLFPKGTKATLIIPSKLAFGADFHKNLGPYTPIICEVEVLDIKHKI